MSVAETAMSLVTAMPDLSALTDDELMRDTSIRWHVVASEFRRRLSAKDAEIAALRKDLNEVLGLLGRERHRAVSAEREIAALRAQRDEEVASKRALRAAVDARQSAEREVERLREVNISLLDVVTDVIVGDGMPAPLVDKANAALAALGETKP